MREGAVCRACAFVPVCVLRWQLRVEKVSSLVCRRLGAAEGSEEEERDGDGGREAEEEEEREEG